jgi:hypothetical protein
VLALRHNDTNHYRLLEDSDLLLELLLESLDKFAVSSQSNLVLGVVSRLGAGC